MPGALGQLRAEEAIEPLLTLLADNADDGNDWIHEEIPVVLGMIGPAALPPAQAFLADATYSLFVRIVATKIFKEIDDLHPELHAQNVAVLTQQLRHYADQDEALNGFLISALVNLHAVEATGVMAEAFAANKVTLDIYGDWEDVQIGLGLLTERITPQPRYGWLAPELQEARQMLDERLAQQKIAAEAGALPKPEVISHSAVQRAEAQRRKVLQKAKAERKQATKQRKKQRK